MKKSTIITTSDLYPGQRKEKKRAVLTTADLPLILPLYEKWNEQEPVKPETITTDKDGEK